MSPFLSFPVLYFSLSLIFLVCFCLPLFLILFSFRPLKASILFSLICLESQNADLNTSKLFSGLVKCVMKYAFNFFCYLFSLQKLLYWSSWARNNACTWLGTFVNMFEPEHFRYNEKIFSINLLLGQPVFLFRFQRLYEKGYGKEENF